MKTNIIRMVLALCLLPISAQARNEGPKETLFARVTLHVSWDKRNENSGEIRTGVMNLAMSGTLTLNREYSGKAGMGRFSPLLSYVLQGADFNYNYREDWIIIRPDNPPKCPNPQRALYKTGSVSGDAGGMPMNLIVHYQKGLAEGAAGLPLAPPSEALAALIDYYEFTVMVPAQKTEGRAKVLNAKTKKCEEIDQSSHLFDGQIEIFFKIGPGGKMSGSKSWSSQSLSNSFSVKVSDLPDTFKKKPAVPQPGGKNDVRYCLTWDLDSAPVAQIERDTGGPWYDITGIDQEVITGEEIRLKGLVAPRSMDTAAGKWDISNMSTVGAKGLDTIVGNVVVPHALDLTHKELAFMFSGKGESEVTYTARAGRQQVTAKVKFRIKEPPPAGG